MEVELMQLARRLVAAPYFSRLSADAMAGLLVSGRRLQLAPGQWLTGSGATQQDHLVVLAGNLQAHRAWVDDKGEPRAVNWQVGVLPDGPGFAVVMASTHGLRLQALTDVEAFALDADRFDALQDWGVQDRPEGALRMNSALQCVPLENALQVRERMVEMEVAAGETIVAQGEPGDAYYVLVEGAAEVLHQDPFTDETGRTNLLSAGDGFGEESLILEGHRTASVRMLSPGRLLRLDKADFDALLKLPMVEEIDAARAHEQLRTGQAVLLDCRYPFEFEEGHLPAARLVPLDRLRQQGVFTLDPAASHIVYCRSGRRSKAAAFLLRERGIRAVSLTGGIVDWPYEVVLPAPG